MRRRPFERFGFQGMCPERDIVCLTQESESHQVIKMTVRVYNVPGVEVVAFDVRGQPLFFCLSKTTWVYDDAITCLVIYHVTTGAQRIEKESFTFHVSSFVCL